MRVVITGGRAYANQARVFEALDTLHAERPISLVIHGGAGREMNGRPVAGADLLAAEWARRRGIQRDMHRANWNDVDPRPGWPVRIKVKDGRPYNCLAGLNRNLSMLRLAEADLVVAFPGGKGTEHCRGHALKQGIPVLDVED